MRSRRPLFVALGVLAALLVWLVVWSGRAGDVGQIRGVGAHSALDASPAASPGRAEREDLASGAVARRDAVAAASAPSDVPSPPDASTAPRGVELIAIDASTGERVPQAQFLWWPQRRAHLGWTSDGLESLLFEGRLDEALAARAAALSPDEQGRTFTPAPDATGYAVASSASLWGHAFVDPNNPAPARVLLFPDDEVRVRVVDRHGAPAAGARVALRSYLDRGRYYDLVRAYADEDGIARLRHILALAGDSIDPSERHTIALAEPLRTPVLVDVDLDALPTSTVELTIPATGVVEVEVRGVEEVARREDVWVNLSRVAEDGAPATRYPEPRPLLDGAARFPAVELGGELLAFITWSDSSTRVEEVRGPAPTRAGEVVRLVLRSERNSRVLRGRLVDANGPLIERELELEVGEGPQAAFRRPGLRTDAEGRFDCELGLIAPSESRLAFHLLDSGQRVASAHVPLSSAPIGVATDLGDVQLAALEEFLAGVVLDSDDTPVAGAWVESYTLAPTRPGADRTYWMPSSVRARCDAQGRFRFVGEAPQEPMALRAGRRERIGAPQRVERGRRDVVLRLDDTGSIAGRVLVPSVALARRVSVVARAAALDGVVVDLRDTRSVQLEHDGSFELRGLCAGSYELAFEFEGLDEPLAELHDVLVRVGSESIDPRLAPLDLRAAFDFVSFDVRASDGHPVRWGTLGWLGRDGEVHEAGFYNGRLLAQRSWSAETAWILVEEHLLEPIDLTGSGGVVTLRRAPLVRLRLPPDAPQLGEALEAWAVLRFEREGWLSEWIDDALEFSAGVAEGFPLHHGAVRVELWIDGERALECSKRIAIAPALNADAPAQEFELELSLDELRRAIEAAQD